MRAAMLMTLFAGLTSWLDPLEIALGLLSVGEVTAGRLLDGDLAGAISALVRL